MELNKNEETTELLAELSVQAGELTLAEILNRVYPIGSVYISVNSNSPSSLIGGTWLKFAKGKTLVGVDENDEDFNLTEKTGGEKSVALTTAQMPRHTHSPITSVYGSNGNTSDRTGQSRQFGYKGAGEPLAGLPVDIHETGEGQVHNNVQPYITTYMWKRIG